MLELQRRFQIGTAIALLSFGFGFGIQTPFDPYSSGGTPAVEAVIDVGSPAELGLVMTGLPDQTGGIARKPGGVPLDLRDQLRGINGKSFG